VLHDVEIQHGTAPLEHSEHIAPTVPLSDQPSPLHAPDRRSHRCGRDETGIKIRSALESAGIEFIDENGGGPGVRLRKRQQKKW
jgi:hypothetical protein